MAKVKVGVAGYGTIGTRLADGVALQEDMELVGIVGHSPSLAIRALAENDMIGVNGVEYKLYLVDMELKPKFDELGIPVAGSFEELCGKVDVMLDASPGGTGAKNKAVYEKLGVKAIFRREEQRGRRVLPWLCQLRAGPGQAVFEADQLQHHGPDPCGGLPGPQVRH